MFLGVVFSTFISIFIRFFFLLWRRSHFIICCVSCFIKSKNLIIRAVWTVCDVVGWMCVHFRISCKAKEMPKMRLHIVVVICLCISRVRSESKSSEVSGKEQTIYIHIYIFKNIVSSPSLAYFCKRHDTLSVCVCVNSLTHTNQPSSWKLRTKRKWDDANDDDGDVDGNAKHIVSANERKMNIIIFIFFSLSFSGETSWTG